MLRLDITGVLAKTVTPSKGLPEQDLIEVQNTLKKHVEAFVRECTQGEHSWTQDPYNDRLVDRCREIAARVKRESIQTVVWVGIGGSGLGPKVLQEAFESPHTVEFLVLDTIDPHALSLYLSILDWNSTMVVVVSKSGNTLETMSAFFLLWEQLKKTRKRAAAGRVVAITDARKGPLRTFCLDHNIEMLPIPKETGGRYSIFSPVGILAVTLLKANPEEFLRGAKDMEKLCRTTKPGENPAALLAGVQYLLDTRRDYRVRVIMPYAHRLQSIARWNQQLVAESLGKTDRRNPIPVAATGTQDQHSLLQQWMEGPRVAWHLFIREVTKPALVVPRDLPDAFSFIEGKPFGTLLDACYEGTRQGLTATKHPHVTIELDRIDEYHLGSLFSLLLHEVVFLGKLYRIDPYGQPGVELGKTITRELLESQE